jgi:hypothetical protein
VPPYTKPKGLFQITHHFLRPFLLKIQDFWQLLGGGFSPKVRFLLSGQKAHSRQLVTDAGLAWNSAVVAFYRARLARATPAPCSSLSKHVPASPFIHHDKRMERCRPSKQFVHTSIVD